MLSVLMKFQSTDVSLRILLTIPIFILYVPLMFLANLVITYRMHHATNAHLIIIALVFMNSQYHIGPSVKMERMKPWLPLIPRTASARLVRPILTAKTHVP